MCIRQLPIPEERDKQVAQVTNNAFRDLILSCLKTDPEQRPSMEQVIEKLEQFNGTS